MWVSGDRRVVDEPFELYGLILGTARWLCARVCAPRDSVV